MDGIIVSQDGNHISKQKMAHIDLNFILNVFNIFLPFQFKCFPQVQRQADGEDAGVS